MTDLSPDSPDAELLLATGCAHCAIVLEGLSQLVKEGLIGHLEITNIVPRPQRAQELNVRSVPWTRLGPFILEGQHSPGELRKWAQRANSTEGMSEYIAQELKQGNLNKLINMLNNAPQQLRALIPLLEDEDTEMQVRIGIDAILESIEDKASLAPLIPEFSQLASHKSPRIRADISHYLALTENPEAIPVLQKQLQDESEEIREIAREGLEKLLETCVIPTKIS
ncbi:MAG TPA: HEAT repeat domain-containing protein [Gammaproteobacteria bacterium]|nr:HEAT repeat domain-containing protein [Gammaproteobacteria bacterium]